MQPQDLQKIGFSDKEAAVYLASLELGPASIIEIAKKSRVNRATTYVVMDSLIKKGLAASFEKGKKRYFAVDSPEGLLGFFRLKEQELKEQEREFKTIFPALKEIYEMAGEKPKVRFFEGKEGIRAIQEDILKTKTKILREFTSLDEAYEFFPPGPADHRKKLAKKVKEVRMIYTSKKGPILPRRQGPFNSLFVPLSKFPFVCDIVAYANKVALVAYKEKLVGVVIENKTIAQTMKAIFELSWQGGQKQKG